MKVSIRQEYSEFPCDACGVTDFCVIARGAGSVALCRLCVGHFIATLRHAQEMEGDDGEHEYDSGDRYDDGDRGLRLV